ncbi:MAG: peptide deformylase [Alphaproteobacteria bacterium]|jgi:peptide deformylase|nr:peptide deformylase [Alphaproteobacteria bacterium]
MAKLKVYEYPHPVLKQKAEKVAKVDDKIRSFLDDMLETMYDAAGVGLAAPQVGVSKRIVVIDVAHPDEGEERNPIYLVNPEIIWHSDEESCQYEGCLSVPDQSAEVSRYKQVRVQYLDYNGKEAEIMAEGLLAIALQHEIDHLDGILYIDRISRLKRQMLLKKLQKMRQEEE